VAKKPHSGDTYEGKGTVVLPVMESGESSLRRKTTQVLRVELTYPQDEVSRMTEKA